MIQIITLLLMFFALGYMFANISNSITKNYLITISVIEILIIIGCSYSHDWFGVGIWLLNVSLSLLQLKTGNYVQQTTDKDR